MSITNIYADTDAELMFEAVKRLDSAKEREIPKLLSFFQALNELIQALINKNEAEWC